MCGALAGAFVHPGTGIGGAVDGCTREESRGPVLTAVGAHRGIFHWAVCCAAHYCAGGSNR